MIPKAHSPGGSFLSGATAIYFYDKIPFKKWFWNIKWNGRKPDYDNAHEKTSSNNPNKQHPVLIFSLKPYIF